MIVDASMLAACGALAAPAAIMQHVVQVESGFNPYAIGVVGARLQRQPRSLREALDTANALRREGRNYSVGLAQVNQANFKAQGLRSHAEAFDMCSNLQAGARILGDCFNRFGTWGKALSCYYSGNPRTGFAHGYVQKVQALMAGAPMPPGMAAADAPVMAAAPAAAELRMQRRLRPVEESEAAAPAWDRARVF